MGLLLRKKIYKRYRSIHGSTHMAIKLKNTTISKMRECASSCENVHSLVLRCYKIIRLIGMGSIPQNKKFFWEIYFVSFIVIMHRHITMKLTKR